MNRNATFNVLKIVAAVGLILLVVTWLVVEYTGTRTFIGRLQGKHADTWYTHDEERLVPGTDSDGNPTLRTEGEDETTAHIRYVLDFYCDGKLRSVSTGSFSARVGYRHAEGMAMNRLMSNHTVPPHYTYTQVGQEYLVDVRGWLLDGEVRDITLLSLVPKEKP